MTLKRLRTSLERNHHATKCHHLPRSPITPARRRLPRVRVTARSLQEEEAQIQRRPRVLLPQAPRSRHLVYHQGESLRKQLLEQQRQVEDYEQRTLWNNNLLSHSIESIHQSTSSTTHLPLATFGRGCTIHCVKPSAQHLPDIDREITLFFHNTFHH